MVNRFIEIIKKLFLKFPVPFTIFIGVFFLVVFPPFIKPIGILFFVLAPLIGSSMKRIRNEKQGNFKTDHFNERKTRKKYYSDIKNCEIILSKIKNTVKKNNISELKDIYKQLQDELKNGKKIAKKIDSINESLREPDWNLDKLNQRIKKEESTDPVNLERLEKLKEMKEQILRLKNRRLQFINQISDLALSFQTIYTKMALLDSEDFNSFDQIETEIQKILDFKLKVSEFEEELNDELKNY
jgi:predicted RNase H-like nuclease (RuvC/YqgF family)